MPQGEQQKTSRQTETFQRVEWLVRTRRLDEAARMVADAFAAGDHNPPLMALGGAIECHRGAFADALPYLRQAMIARPDDLVIRANLVDALARSGDSDGARALCDEASVRADGSLRLARLGAHLAQQADDSETAIALYRHILGKADEDWASWNNLGNALSALGRFDEAIPALENAVRLAPDAPPIRVNFGETLLQAGRTDEGIASLRRAAADFPDDPHPLLVLFRHYDTNGEEAEMLVALSEAARRAPDRADIQSDFGHVTGQRNEFDTAERAFRRALAVAPGFTAAVVGLGAVLERLNREDELEPLRADAQRDGAEPQAIAYLDTLRLKRADRFEEALAALDRAGDVMIPSRKWQLRGQILDRLGRPDEAFAAFRAMNAAWLDEPGDPRGRAADYRREIRDAMALVTPQWRDSWSPALPSDRRSPVFIVGFPRSGTTLLDTMLMAVPEVRVLEEEPFIADLEAELGGIAALPGLTAADIAAARARYFERVGQVVQLDADAVVIDKHPMHLNKVPVILRLFPDAQFILALRHPCDVLLSCLMTNFRLNAAMANFLDLDDAAALYDLTFTNWSLARAVFSPQVSEVVYEQLVVDPDGVLRPLFAQIGLDWPEGTLDHRVAGRARGAVRTASYAQVTEPLYQRAAGRWRRYSEYLAPVMPILGKWIADLGYDA